MGIMLSGHGAVWLGGACCWEKWWLTKPMSMSAWAEWGKNKQTKKISEKSRQFRKQTNSVKTVFIFHKTKEKADYKFQFK